MDFNDFLDECKEETDFLQQNIRSSFLDNWKLLIDGFRRGEELPDKPGYRSISLEGINTYQLNDEEAFFILSYTASKSRWLNHEAMIGISMESKCKQLFAEGLERSLNKIPSYNSQFVFRMDGPPGTKEEVVEWFKLNIGITIYVPYFLSTSKDNFENTDITWHIKTMSHNSKAKDITLISNNKVEKEVLFNRDSFFKVTGVDSDSDIISMIEVEASTDSVRASGFYFAPAGD